MNKNILYRSQIVLVSLIILLSGCETMKGAMKGLGKGMSEIGEGISRDLRNTAENIKEADEWFKKHAW